MAMTNATGTRCLTHPDDEAVNRCTSCRKPLCAKCSMKKAEGVFCSEGCWNKSRQHQDRLKTLKVKDSKFEEMERERKMKASVVYFILGLVVVGLVVYVLKNPNSPLVESIKSVLGPLLKKIGLLK